MLSKFLKMLSIAAILSASTFSYAHADKPLIRKSFDRVFNFGDSLTDGRHLSDISPSQTQAEAGNEPIYQEGGTYAKHFAADNNFTYGVDSGDTPTTLPSTTNFARAGATTRTGENDEANTINGFISDPSNSFTTSQIDDFLANRTPQNNDLITVWIGHNNLNRERPAGSEAVATVATTAAGDVLAGLKQLHAAGARNFLVLNLANFADTPFFIENKTDIERKGATTYSQVFTKKLTAQTKQLPKSYNIIQLDLTQLQKEVVANPEAILGAGNRSFFLPQNEDLEISGNSFNVHPSLLTQKLIASWVTDMVNAPLPFVVLGDYPIDLMAGNVNNSYNRMYMLKHQCHEKSGFRFYAEGSDGAYKVKKKGSEITGKSDLWSIGFGSEYQFKDRHTIGIKLAHMESDVKFNQLGLKDVEFNETLVSLYSFLFPGNFNIALIASYGAIDVESTRTIKLGIKNRNEKGSGTGDHWLASARIGYDFKPYEPVTLSPYIGVDIHNVRIQSIKEQSNSSTSMEFKLPRSRAQFYRAGLEAVGEIYFNDDQFCFTPFLNLAYVEERRQRSNKIKARATRFDRFFELKSTDVMHKDRYLFLDAGAGLSLSPKDSININYQTRLFSDKQEGHNIVAFYSRAI